MFCKKSSKTYFCQMSHIVSTTVFLYMKGPTDFVIDVAASFLVWTEPSQWHLGSVSPSCAIEKQ